MAPKESSPLIGAGDGSSSVDMRKQFSMEDNDDGDNGNNNNNNSNNNNEQTNNKSSSSRNHNNKLKRQYFLLLVAGIVLSAVFLLNGNDDTSDAKFFRHPTGPYRLVELQTGKHFFDHYDFLDGPDSLGSAGYQTYVSKSRAMKMQLANVTKETITTSSENGSGVQEEEEEEEEVEFVYLQSSTGLPQNRDKKTGETFRESVRLEGKRRFDRGLFILDVQHMPTGCGVWPAFWLTDEANWPNNGEIDIVEGINTQSVAKTALHTSESCSMFAHVPRWNWTGDWDTATGLPDTYTGIPNFDTKVDADNCWAQAPHQWGNQGCVAVSNENGTIGTPMNERGGGVYVLEWDPANGYIKSWVFPKGTVPENLQETMRTAELKKDSSNDASNSNSKSKSKRVEPRPETWDTPYAYFAIGEKTRSGCSSDHFQNMRLVFNLAFCGAVAGNRFFKDCPALAHDFNVQNNSVLTCNAYMESEPESLSEAYWKIRGVYVYERDLERA